MTSAETLHGLFQVWAYDSTQTPSGAQAALLCRLIDVYLSAGVLRSIDEPGSLCDVCPNASACWRDAPRAVLRRGPAGDGTVLLPWVGRKYEPGRGVVTVGVNPNVAPEHTTDLLLEHGITWTQVIPGLAGGAARPGGSRFHFGAMRSAAALLDLADGAPVRDRPAGELADVVHRVARLQAIKCVPRTPRAKPLAPMWHHCPDLLLHHELDALRPGTILALGADARWAVWRLDGFSPRPAPARDLWRGVLWREGWQAEVYGVRHPSAPGAEAAERALIAALRQHDPAGSEDH